MRWLGILGLGPLLSLSALATPPFNPDQKEKTGDRKADPKAVAAELEKLLPLFHAVEGARVKGKRWVQVDTGPNQWDLEGWLIEDGKEAVKILTNGGRVESIYRVRGDGRQRKIKDGDFTAFCRQFLAEGLVQDDEGKDGVYSLMRDRARLRDHVIQAARYACWAHQQGQQDLAAKLLAHARAAHEQFTGNYIAEDKSSLPKFLGHAVTLPYRLSAISGSHWGTPRAKLLDQWRFLVKIPDHPFRQEAEDMVRHYESLLAEDRAWKEPDAQARAKLTVEQQVAYWLYHLRDLDVAQMSDPGMCHVVTDGWGVWAAQRNPKKPNPAVELKKLGMAALPAIIAHLDDPRPTRCQGHWRSYWPESYYPLRYGDCCQQIFESITGRTIYNRRTTNGYPIADGKGKECKANAEKWLQEYQKKGEKQMLIEGTAAGDGDSTAQAARLVKKYPDAAFDALVQGVKRSSEKWIRSNLVSYVCGLKDKRVPGFLREELKGPVLSARVGVAQELMRRGHDEGLKALIADWRRLDAFNYGYAGFEESWDVEALVQALAHSGYAQGLQALRTDLRKRPVYLRWHVVEVVSGVEKDKGDNPYPAAVRNAVDELLVQALADTEECGYRSIRWKDQHLDYRTVGDHAATHLARRWGLPDAFDPSAPWRTRVRQKAELTNLWRAKQSQKPLPVPQRPTITPLPEAQSRPLLNAVRSGNDRERTKALAALESHGLPAAAAVNWLLPRLPAGHPAYAELHDLAARLRCIVEQVEFASDFLPPDAELAKLFNSWRGKRVTAQELVSSTLTAMDRLPKGACGVLVALEHAGDGGGTLMVVSLRAKHPLSISGPGKSWQTTERIMQNEKALRNTGLGTYRAITAKDLQEFAAQLRTVLDSAPEQPFSVRLGVAVDQR